MVKVLLLQMQLLGVLSKKTAGPSYLSLLSFAGQAEYHDNASPSQSDWVYVQGVLSHLQLSLVVVALAYSNCAGAPSLKMRGQLCFWREPTTFASVMGGPSHLQKEELWIVQFIGYKIAGVF